LNQQALTRKVTAIVGVLPRGPLEFQMAVDHHKPEAQRLQRLILFLAQELEHSSKHFPDLVLDELEEAVITEVVCGTRHNLSDLLARRQPAIAPWQVRLVEEYIEDNFNQAVTIELLAAVTGASARSIFSSFQKWRGYSPIAFLRSVRLRQAHNLLMAADATTSVTSVALACGFRSLGHFARDYSTIFGELPSATLQKAHGAPSPPGLTVAKRKS
jgi:transcriptional regulator GlxA family with amidase domain